MQHQGRAVDRLQPSDKRLARRREHPVGGQVLRSPAVRPFAVVAYKYNLRAARNSARLVVLPGDFQARLSDLLDRSSYLTTAALLI